LHTNRWQGPDGAGILRKRKRRIEDTEGLCVFSLERGSKDDEKGLVKRRRAAEEL